MKTFKLSFLLFGITLMGTSAAANDEKFVQAMQQNIKLIYEARELDEFQEAVNSFERIAGVEKNRWEPLYYIAYGNIMMANFAKEGAKKDTYLDKAVTAISIARKLAPNESEVYALEGFLFMIRVTVDPQNRGMMYAPSAMQSFGKALELDGKNPRALALMAQMQYGTASFFNSPTTEACETNAKALENFETYHAKNPLAPAWGKNMAESMIQRCK